MPTYAYSCQKCGQNFKAFQSMRDEPFRECPKELCQLPKWGHGKVKRLFGAGAGLIFKGSGFYQTDYRSESYKKAAEAEKPKTESSSSNGDSSSKSETKSETKTESKSETKSNGSAAATTKAKPKNESE